MEVPMCINGNKAINICTSDHCVHPNPFICDNCANNQCQQLHQNCIIQPWKKIKSMMEKSKKPNNPECIKISNDVEQTINKAMKYLQKQLEYFKLWKQTFGMPIEAMNLLKCIQEKQEHKFTGKQVAQILKDLKTEKEIQKYNEVKIKNTIKEVLEKMEQTQKMIREMYHMWDGDNIKQDMKKPNIKQEYKVSQVAQLETKKKVENKQELKKPNIEQEFKVPQVPQLSLKIKQTYLWDVNKKLKNLKEKPTDLEIKFFLFQFNELKQFAESLKNPNLKSLKTLTLYYPDTLGHSYSINAEKLISSSLLSLLHISSVTIIANDIKSLDGFTSLGRKLNASKDEGWHKRQEW